MKISGAIDGLTEQPFCLRGWAKCTESEVIEISARADGNVIAKTTTGLLRKDLSGNHGFQIEIPGPQLDVLRGLLSGRLQLHASSKSSTVELTYFRAFEQRLFRKMVAAIVATMNAEESTKFFTEINEINKHAPKAAKSEENIIAGAKREPLSFFGLKPGLVSPSGTSIVGRLGYMFILSGTNDLLKLYRADPNSEKTTAQAQAWIDIFKARQDNLADRGII